MDIRSKTKNELISLIEGLNLKLAAYEQELQLMPGIGQSGQLHKNSLARAKALLDAIPDLMFVFDADCRFIDYHAEKLETLYLDPKKFLGQKPEEVLPYDVGVMTSSKIKAILESGQPGFITYDLNVNGEKRNFESRGVLYGENQVMFIVRDITDLRRETELKRDLDIRYRAILKASPDDITITDLNGRILLVSPVGVKMFGYETEEEIKEKLVIDFIAPEDHERVKSVFTQAFTGALPIGPMDFTGLRKDGSTFDIEVNGEFLKDAEGNPKQIIFILRDVTARKQAGLMLKQIRQNYETFFNTIDEFLFVLDDKGNIIHVNSLVTDRLGYLWEELSGQSVLMVHPPERHEEALKIVGEMLNGSAEYCPVPLITKTGVYIPVETRVTHGTWDGKPVIFGVSKDISKLRLSEEKFSKIFYINPSACGLSDLETHQYIEVNESFSDLLGFTNEEAAGKTPVELGIATSAMIDAITAEAKKRGNIKNIEAHLKAKNREIKQVLLSAEDIFIQEKKYRFTVVNDITERKKAEADLEESREKYRGLSEAAFEAIFISEKGVCIEQNHAAEQMFGYTSEEAIGRYGTEWIVPEDRDMVMKNMLSWYEEPYEATALKKDGSTFPCVLKGKMMNYKGKNVRVTSLSDHTARIKAEEELRIKDWAIESSISAIAISDLLGNMKYANPAFLKLWGFDSLPEVIGKPPLSFWKMEKETNAAFELLTTGGSWSGELTAVNKQGESFIVQIEASLVKDAQGRAHSMLASFADITERKKVISALLEAKEKAEAGNRLKTAFINNISHEIRTPLNGIIGFSNLITQTDITATEREKFCSQIKLSSLRLLETVTNYMDISLIASGNLEVRLKPVRLNKILNQLFNNFHSLCEERNLELRLVNIPGDHSVTVITDEELLKTIITHILNNAVTFTSKGGITFGFEIRPGTVEFFVRDTGVGISSEMRSSIFESFVQVSTSASRGHEGSGLGLSIARGMAKLLGGDIRVESQPGAGSSFFITIPDEGLKKENPGQAVSEPAINTLQDPVILVSEDDSTNLMLVRVMLKQSGIRVIEAKDGLEAVKQCREHPEISLALMDLKMPVMDGFEATRQIKSFRKSLPVIAVTAYALSGDEKLAIEAGCSDYLAKPYEKNVLLNKLKRYGII